MNVTLVFGIPNIHKKAYLSNLIGQVVKKIHDN